MTSATVICGLGTCLPDRVVSNADLSLQMDTSDEWIRSRTGISRRHMVEPGTSAGDLAVSAGRAALISAGRQADCVLLATTTPDYPCPATAPEVAHRLALGHVPALDVAAVCSGFVYAVALARALVESGSYANPLVICAETYSSIVDPLDRETAVIFADGAGAVMLGRGSKNDPGAIHAVDLGSDGSGSDLIRVAAGGSRLPSSTEDLPREQRYVKLRGRVVYRQAIDRMVASGARALEQAGWSAGSVRSFIGHQANQRILDVVADRLRISARCRFGNIAEVGNTAAASIPLAMADTAARGCVQPGARTLLTAFGGGLTWGSLALAWPDASPVQLSPEPQPQTAAADAFPREARTVHPWLVPRSIS